MEPSEFMEALGRANHLYQTLRPDIVIRNVTGYQFCFEDPVGGPTDEPPPRPLAIDAEQITIDEFLGIYIPAERTIKVFTVNIRKAADMLKCREEDLQYVVRYHKEAHAVIHLGVAQDEKLKGLQDDDFRASRLGELTRAFAKIEPTLHEHLAQLVTYHALNNLPKAEADNLVSRTARRMLSAFTKLMQRQPPAYRVDPYLDVSLERLSGTIHLIKDYSLIGRFAPWKEIMKWG